MPQVIWVAIFIAILVIFGFAMHITAKPEQPLPTQRKDAPPDQTEQKKLSTEEINRANEPFFARQPFNEIDPAKPFDWELSENSNPTCEWNLLTCTVFQQDGFWKYVINSFGGDSDDAIFSKSKGPQETMKTRAEKKMREMVATALQNRSIH